jgi:hypothetical protein
VCVYCAGPAIQLGAPYEQLVDERILVDENLHQYLCRSCHRTFSQVSPPADNGHLTQPLRRLAALMWVLGLSLREVVDSFAAQGVNLNRMTIWREGQQLIEELRGVDAHAVPGECLSIETGFDTGPLDGQVGLALQLQRGQAVRLGLLNTTDAQMAITWLQCVLGYLGIDALINLISQ